MFFVAGITGNVGGAAARQLLQQGHTLRTLARDPARAAHWSEQGVEVRQGHLDDPAALTAALQGVEGAFLLIPPTLTPSPGFPETKAILASYKQALSQAPPPRLVLLSSIGSEQPSGLGLITSTHLMEEALADLPLPTAFLRAGGFYENYLGVLPSVAATGVLYSFYQPLDRPVPMIATSDIGAEAARLLSDTSWAGNKIVELGSPISPNDLAHAISEALGRPVQAQAVPREHWAATLETFGMPPGTTSPYEEMIDGFNRGWIHFGAPGAEAVAATVTADRFFQQTKQQS